MHDTTPAVTEWLRGRYLDRSGSERLVMGAQMFESARTLVLASLPADLSPAQVRRQLCLRFYGEALTERVLGRA
jgi:hypothetical protein